MDSVDAILSENDENDGNCFSSDANGNNEEKSYGANGDGANGGGEGSGGGLKRVLYDPTSLDYDMSGDKLMYIFNHHKFNKTPYFTSHLDDRDGTQYDVARLQKTFGDIGFAVDKPCHDYTQQEILTKLEEICKMDHRNTSCVIIVILTHGDGGGVVTAADMPYQLSIVVNRILNEPNLAGKPKLFFIQACRGSSTDAGHRISVDGRSVFVIPTHSDYLVIRSSFEEHVSFRTSKGSWMIQALCDVVDEHAGENILDMATQVNHRVAKKISFVPEVPKYHEKKQVPEVWFTLTKNLKLFERDNEKSSDQLI